MGDTKIGSRSVGEIISIGDSISKTTDNDTMLIYRNNKEYYFVLNKKINKR